MFKKKIIASLIAMICSLLVPAALVWAEPPPPSGTPILPRQPNAPTAGNCISNVGRGTYITGTVGSTVKNPWAGVILVTLANGTTAQAFCIELLNPTYIGDCYTPGGTANPHVNWLIQNYPPDNTLSNEENAARQAAVWRFSDGFVITAPASIVTRTNQIIATVPTDPAPNTNVPQLQISPGAVILGNGKPYTFTVTATRGGITPIAGQLVTLATNFGTLGANQVTTGADGTATFVISNAPDNPGSAYITATMTTTIPAGTILNNVLPNRQKIMFGTSVSAAMTANARATWSNSPTAVTLSSFAARADTASDFSILALASGLCLLGLIVVGVWRK